MKRPLKTAHVPNGSLSFREVAVALVRSHDVEAAERFAASSLGFREVVLFASARGALSSCVRLLADGEEVAVPAFTCAAVANAVISAGKVPRFVDIGARGLVPPEAWPAGALPLVQDTYGFRAVGPPDRTFVRDSAHRAFPLESAGAAVVVTSFEHSKSLSAGRGGLAATDDAALAADLRRLRDQTRGRGPKRDGVVTLATLAMGRLDARGLHRSAELFRKVAWHIDATRLLGQSATELAAGGVDNALLGAAGGTQARLIVSQIGRAAGIAARRARVVALYDLRAGLERAADALVRYPMTVDDPTTFEAELARAGWDVRGRWFDAPLHGGGGALDAFGYRPGSAPNAERLASTVVNLPTHPLVRWEHAEDLIRAALAAGAQPLT